MTRKNRVSLTDLLTEIAAWVIVAGIVGICAAVTIAYYAARFTTGAGA